MVETPAELRCCCSACFSLTKRQVDVADFLRYVAAGFSYSTAPASLPVRL